MHPSTCRRIGRLSVFVATLLWWVPALGALSPSAQDRYEVHLLTIDQGDQVWELFGHNALLVIDRDRGSATAWNWGIFDFGDVDFIPRFLRGTMRYQMAGMNPDAMVEAYRRDNRTIWANQVFLTPDEAEALAEHIAWHNLPENRHYTYDYFRDNCSTRIRDALDLAMGGTLLERFHPRETPHSYRWHSRRLVQVTGWVDQGLSFLLGPRGDVPLTEWEAMFIPMEMTRLLEGYERPGPDGEPMPLLGPREVIFEANRLPTPDDAPPFSAFMALLGFLGGGLLLFLGWKAAEVRGRGPSGNGDRFPGPTSYLVAFGTAAGIWTLFSGALGWLLVASWFTDHVFIHWNLNLFYASPLAPLVLVFLVPALASGARARGFWGRWAWRTAAVVAALSVGMGLLQAVGIFSQGNGEVIAAALPLNLALALAAARIHREAPLGSGAQPLPATEATASTTRSASAITL